MTVQYTPNLADDLTEGDWDFACDSYGKVRHSRKACVYTTVTKPGGDQLVSVASRVENWADARVLSAAKDLFLAMKALNHMGGDERGGYCICPLNDGSAEDERHATCCAGARKALVKAEGISTKKQGTTK